MAEKDPNHEVSTAESIQTAVTEQLSTLTGLLDGGIDAASDALKSGTAAARVEVEKVSGLAKEWYQVAGANVAKVDEAVMSTLKKGVSYAIQYENASIAAAVGIVAIALPGPRRLLWRMTFGRFQSAEAAQRAAEQRLVSLGEVIDSQAGEAEKLAERLALAREEYARGLSKVKAAASELRSLASRVEGTERTTRNLMHDLRALRSKHALQMRSDLAVKATAVSKQKAAVEKVVDSLAKDGF